jgi:hypothetical protein
MAIAVCATVDDVDVLCFESLYATAAAAAAWLYVSIQWNDSKSSECRVVCVSEPTNCP